MLSIKAILQCSLVFSYKPVAIGHGDTLYLSDISAMQTECLAGHALSKQSSLKPEPRFII